MKARGHVLLLLLCPLALRAETAAVIGVQKLTLIEGRNYVSLSTLPATNTLAAVLETNRLPAAATEAAATVVDIWDQTAQSLTNRYWLSNATGFTGWRVSGTFADANGVLLDANKGMIVIIRAGQGNRTLYLAGQVPKTNQVQTVQNNGYTLAASRFPKSIAPSNANLIASGFIGGTSLVTSDRLLFFNPQTQLFDIKLWYDSNGSIWRDQNAAIATNQLQPGEAVLIYRKNRGANFAWTNPVPYNVPQVFP